MWRECPAPSMQVGNGLKDFQRRTVDYVFERFYGDRPTRRFLVADEVGLGKTLVARALARSLDERDTLFPNVVDSVADVLGES